MREKVAILLLLCCLSGGCSLFTPGPKDPVTQQPTPSVFEISVKEAAKEYSESPWATFGPYGAGIAGILAALAGIRKGKQVLDARKERKANEQ